MKLVTIFVGIVFFSHTAVADCQSVSGNCRKCYDNENAPPAVVYQIFIREIFIESLDYLEDLNSLDDEEYHAGKHYVEAGLTPNMSSADVVRYFVPKFLEIEKEAKEAQKRTLCYDKKPRYEGAENFVIFNQLEEVALNVYEEHYHLARSDLQASGLFDLDKALKEYPASFINCFMDHKKAHDGSAKRIKQKYEAAASLCEKPWGYQFSMSVSESERQPKIQ